MIVDTSAVVACVTGERQWRAIIDALEAAETRSISAATLLELRIVLSADRFNRGDVGEEFLRRYKISTTDFTEAHATTAARAYERFGKGKHPARLNFGDCVSYATAKLADEPLLFVGDDFSQTDITPALIS